MPGRLTCLNPDCKRTFNYAAKRCVNTWEDPSGFPPGGPSARAVLKESTEHYVCPFCGSKNIDETEIQVPVPVVQQPIEDILKVPFEQVRDYIEKGYVELDRKDHVYANGLVMVKLKEEPKQEA